MQANGKRFPTLAGPGRSALRLWRGNAPTKLRGQSLWGRVESVKMHSVRLTPPWANPFEQGNGRTP